MLAHESVATVRSTVQTGIAASHFLFGPQTAMIFAPVSSKNYRFLLNTCDRARMPAFFHISES